MLKKKRKTTCRAPATRPAQLPHGILVPAIAAFGPARPRPRSPVAGASAGGPLALVRRPPLLVPAPTRPRPRTRPSSSTHPPIIVPAHPRDRPPPRLVLLPLALHRPCDGEADDEG
jgi:hypothetical protein